jgi:hypothetical protein
MLTEAVACACPEPGKPIHTLPSLFKIHFYNLVVGLVLIIDLITLYDMILINLLTAIGLPPGDSSTVHIYTQTVHRTTQSTHTIHTTTQFTY